MQDNSWKVGQARAAKATFAIFGVMFLVPLAVGLVDIYMEGIKGLTLIGIGLLAVLGPIASFRLTWGDGEVTYRYLFNFSAVKMSDVSRYLRHGARPDFGYFSVDGLSLFIKGRKRPVLTVNLKAFARKDIELFVQFVDNAIENNRGGQAKHLGKL